MRDILFVNACVMRETSRTQRLADAFLDKLLEEDPSAEVTEVTLSEAGIMGLTEETLAFRNGCVESGDFSDSMFDAARQWAAADEIVIAAPYWDISFPAMLKEYVEQLCVNGLTFSYSEEGIPVGHCRASRVTYITTVGGYTGEDLNMGYDYIAAVCRGYFGIQQVDCIKAEGLDIWGNDPEAILTEAIAAL